MPTRNLAEYRGLLKRDGVLECVRLGAAFEMPVVIVILTHPPLPIALDA